MLLCNLFSIACCFTGAMTGIAASFVLCPLELVKCRLQARQQMMTGQRSQSAVHIK